MIFIFILSNSSHSAVEMQRLNIHVGLQTMKYEWIFKGRSAHKCPYLKRGC